MSFNPNVSWGRAKMDASHILASLAPTAKLFLVGSSSVARRYIIDQVFKNDQEGYNRIFTTIDDAINACTASAGDVILVMPGHTETISSATALNLDVAGISIVGLGVGSLRPTITLDTATTTTIPVSAANITVKNMIFTANFADIVSVFTLTTAKNLNLDGNYFKATATDMNFLYIVDTNTTTSDCDGLTIVNNKWIEPDTATLSMVKMDGTNYDINIKNNFLQLGVNNNKASLVAIITGKVIGNSQILDNMVYRLNTDSATGALLVTTDGSTNTGIIARNFVQHADTAAELLVTASSGFGVFSNYASGVAGASGYLLPGADS